MIVWLSGVSGVGKTTIGEQLQINLKWHYSAVYFLDADMCRKNWWPELGLSNRDRTENMLRMARLASFLSRKSNLVIVSCIAPIGPIREEALSICRGSATTKHIYLHTPLITRLNRDPKGLYYRAVIGEIEGLTGYDGRYDIPTNADLSINTSKHSVNEAIDQIYRTIGIISP